MAKFLDREKTLQAIIDILAQAEKEVIFIVPFIRMSPIIQDEIEKASKNGKEILLIYKEDNLDTREKQKLFALQNLTVMHHPYVHSKCYLNENEMVITSMNLYGPTEKRNREMGVSFRKIENGGEANDASVYYDAFKEIKQIIKISEMEKKSDSVAKNGFQYALLSSKKDLLTEYLDITRKVFLNKNFEIFDEDFRNPEIKCFPYYEKTSVTLDYDLEFENDKPKVLLRRISISIHKDEAILKNLYEAFNSGLNSVSQTFENYQVYWNYHQGNITIYPIKKQFKTWDDGSFEERLKIMKPALDSVLNYLKKLEKSHRLY